MKENITPILDRLGLKGNETAVYLSLLQNRPGMFVADLARKTAIKRSSLNLVLDRLHAKGFVTYHIEGARKLFSAEQPEAVLFRFEDSIGAFRSIIPWIRATTGVYADTKVRYFHGKEGVDNIFSDILLSLKVATVEKREVCAITSGKDIIEYLPDHREHFIKKRVKERIPLRWIAPQDSKSIEQLINKPVNEYRQVKTFDVSRYQFTIGIYIYADSVAIINLAGDLAGVVVENDTIAASFKGMYNLLWDSLGAVV